VTLKITCRKGASITIGDQGKTADRIIEEKYKLLEQDNVY